LVPEVGESIVIMRTRVTGGECVRLRSIERHANGHLVLTVDA
jgi:hypothetical protein